MNAGDLTKQTQDKIMDCMDLDSHESFKYIWLFPTVLWVIIPLIVGVVLVQFTAYDEKQVASACMIVIAFVPFYQSYRFGTIAYQLYKVILKSLQSPYDKKKEKCDTSKTNYCYGYMSYS